MNTHFPEERFKEYLLLMGCFVKQGKIDEEKMALPYFKLGNFLNFGSRQHVFIMAFGDFKNGVLSFDDLVAIADWLLQDSHQDAINHTLPLTWNMLAKQQEKIKHFHNILELCINLENEAYLSTHQISKETALQMIMVYYKKYAGYDRRNSIKDFQQLLNQFTGNLLFKKLIIVNEVSPDEYLYRIETNDGQYYIFEVDFIDNFKYVTDFIKNNIGDYAYFVAVKKPLEKFQDSSPFKVSSIYSAPQDFDEIKKYANDKFGSFKGYFNFLIKK
jgi:hypothetical protein